MRRDAWSPAGAALARRGSRATGDGRGDRRLARATRADGSRTRKAMTHVTIDLRRRRAALGAAEGRAPASRTYRTHGGRRLWRTPTCAERSRDPLATEQRESDLHPNDCRMQKPRLPHDRTSSTARLRTCKPPCSLSTRTRATDCAVSFVSASVCQTARSSRKNGRGRTQAKSRDSYTDVTHRMTATAALAAMVWAAGRGGFKRGLRAAMGIHQRLGG